jgi:hypothetical protein
LAAGFGGTAVESKGELVQVIIPMLLSNRALVGARQPSLQQCEKMLSLFLMAVCAAVMNLSLQPQMVSPAVGSDRASGRNRFSNEPVQAGAGRLRYRTQTKASDALSILVGGDDHESLFLRPSPDCAGFLSIPVGVAHLDDSIQPVAARAIHGTAQLMRARRN